MKNLRTLFSKLALEEMPSAPCLVPQDVLPFVPHEEQQEEELPSREGQNDFLNVPSQEPLEMPDLPDLHSPFDSSAVPPEPARLSCDRTFTDPPHYQFLALEKTIKTSHEDMVIAVQGKPITVKNLRTLQATEWLDDVIINGYIYLINDRDKRRNSGTQQVFGFESYFWPALSKKGHQHVRRWTRNINVFSLDKLLVPLHLNTDHWALAVLNFREKRCDYYDSLSAKKNRFFQKKIWPVLRDYLEQESKDKQVPFSSDGWTAFCAPCPQQQNGCDCGVFTLRFAECVSLNAEWNFSQEDIPQLRRIITWDLAR